MTSSGMMGKRKEVDEEGRSHEQPAIKRIRRTAGQTVMSIDQLRLCQDILETLRNHKTEDGRLLAENFLRAPSRRISPEYHKLVANPIDLMRMQQKLKNEEYDNVEQFVSDVRNLMENAKCFYKKSSQEYKDAVELWNLFVELKGRVFEGMDDLSEASGRSRESSPAQSTRSLRSNSPSRSTRSKDASPGRLPVSGGDQLDRSYLEEFLASLLLLTDENGRSISLAFRHLPAQQTYPEYFTVITNPIDLKTIAVRLRENQYRTLNDIQRDLNLICRNAKTFNEPKSTIYKDANFLKKAVEGKRTEILEMTGRPLDKARALHAAAVLDELLRSNPTDERMGAEEEAEEEEMNEYREDSDEEQPKASSTRAGQFSRVYWAVRNLKEQGQDAALSEPFCRLPSKSVYADYYDEIKNPISMFIINRKIKNGMYERFVELVDDLNLMFNNAKFYNVEGSPIFNAACKLQEIANGLAVEIDPTIDVTQYNVEIPVDQEGDESDQSSGPGKSGKRASTKGRLSRTTRDPLRNKLQAAYDVIVDFRDKTGRWVAEAFMERPSRKLYPDYYRVIPDPIDLSTIKTNIDGDKYDGISSLVADVQLLFSNARHYNEENSQIYNDATMLETVFKKAMPKITEDTPKRIGKWSKPRTPQGCASGSVSAGSAETPRHKSKEEAARRRKMWALYETINEYTDAKGNKLSAIFSKLPSKIDYPDYYEVIKKPIDLQRIYTRLSARNYETLEALAQDINLMLDNACKYNDPESTIYKSALTLQRVLLEKKGQLQDEEMEGKVPDVPTAVQELLTTLFIAMYNHEDEEGRWYSDSLAELPDLIKDKEPNCPVLSLDDIKHKLDKGRYRRLDRFQEDVFKVFHKARQLSRTDSQLFEDATELQQHFILTRNELCRNGEGFASPALKFTKEDLSRLVEEQKNGKQPAESKEDAARVDDPRLSPSKRKEGDTELQSVTVNGITYAKGHFVYVKPNDEKLDKHIMRIERMWRDEAVGQEFVSGNWFYRPYETYHLATRKFLEKEVFRTEFYDSVDAHRLVGKCYVMFVKDYFKYRPQELEDQDVYVCESRYMGRIRHFKKIKYWHIDMDAEKVTFVERTKPILPSRVPSVFSPSHPTPFARADETDEDEDEDCSVLEREQQEVQLEAGEGNVDDGNVYYKKINFNGMWLKLGDGVYVEPVDGGGGGVSKADLYYVECLWRSSQGDGYLKGLSLLRPRDVTVEPTRQCYRREVFGTERRETMALSRVVGKAAVLSLHDYQSVRPTEVPEQHVFVCQCVHQTPAHFTPCTFPNIPTFSMVDDEYYYFKKPVRLEKEELQTIVKMETESERSVLGDVSGDIDSDWLYLKGLHTTPKLGARSKSGYILFSAVVRKRIMAENPDSSFGDISKIVGQEWKKLSDDDKKRYEEEAARIAQEREKADAASGGRQTLQPGQIRVYCCKWKECDFQFETSDQLFDHITTAHTSQIVDGENQYICLWLTCVKYRKDGKPFPSLPRLHRHIKDKHLPTSSKCIQPQNKSKHYVPLVQPAAQSSPRQSPNPSDTQTAATSHTPTAAPQVVYYQQQANTGQSTPTRLVIDAQGNVLSGQQVVIYQVQQTGQTVVGSTSQTVQAPAASMTSSNQQQQTVAQGDPGRVIVQAPQRPAQPVFVAPSKTRVQRVLHSDVYRRYIQGLARQQASNSQWDRSVGIGAAALDRNLPGNMFSEVPDTKEELAGMLFNLRQRILQDTLALKPLLDSVSQFM